MAKVPELDSDFYQEDFDQEDFDQVDDYRCLFLGESVRISYPLSKSLSGPDAKISLQSEYEDNEITPKLSNDQIRVLEDNFTKNPQPDSSAKLQLAIQLNLSRARVNNWYQNRRVKTRHQLDTQISNTHKYEPLPPDAADISDFFGVHLDEKGRRRLFSPIPDLHICCIRILDMFHRCPAAFSSAFKNLDRDLVDEQLGQLFLWGQGFNLEGLEEALDQSTELREMVLESLCEIGKLLIHNISPKPEEILASQDCLPHQVQELHNLIRLAQRSMSRDSKVHGLGDDDEGKYALVDISSEDDAEVSEIGVDLEFHVQCLMDLIPSVQQNITHVEKSRLKDGWSKDQSDPEEPGALIANEGRFFKSPNLAMIAHVNNRDNRISSLARAIESGAVSAVKELLEIQEFTDDTLLNKAIYYGKTAILCLLLQRGANPKILDAYDRTIIHNAAVYGRTEILKILFENSIDVDINAQDIRGQTALHIAASLDYSSAIKILFANNARTSILNSVKQSPLDIAKHGGKLSALSLLTELRKQESERDEYRSYLLKRTTGSASRSHEMSFITAAKLGMAEVIQSYIIRAQKDPAVDLNIVDLDLHSALHYTVQNFYIDVLRLLVSAKEINVDIADRLLRTPLHWTAFYGNYQAAKSLLNAGAAVNSTDHFGETALDVSLYKRRSRLAVLLLEHGAWPQEHLMQVALCEVVRFGSKDLVKKLVADGAEPWKKDRYGQSPYHLVAEAENEETAKIIMQLCDERMKEEHVKEVKEEHEKEEHVKEEDVKEVREELLKEEHVKEEPDD